MRSCRSILSSKYLVPEPGRLNNGMQFLCFPDNSGVSAVALFARAGPRFENESQFIGSSWLLNRMMYSNKNPEVKQLLGELATQLTHGHNRESMFHACQCLVWDMDKCLHTLLQITTNTDFSPEAVEIAKKKAHEDIQNIPREPSKLLFEEIHKAAFSRRTVGQPEWPDVDTLYAIDGSTVQEFAHRHWVANRLVLLATGINANDLLPLMEKNFGHLPSGKGDIIDQKAIYTGGSAMIFNDKPPPSVEKFEERNNSHVAICFEGYTLTHPNYFPMAVLLQLLGGGTSFSAGGPGKGMLTKLYQECIATMHWLWGMEAIHSSYCDTGLFGIYGQAPHEYIQHLVNVVAYQMATLGDRLNDDFVEMAKHQYLANILYHLEERLIVVEDLGKTFMLAGRIWTPAQLREEVSKVTLKDIQRVAKELVSKQPTYVVYGNTKQAPSFANVQEYFARVQKT
eukprot:TRINITY_DN4144_c0_g1_i4.p1 TRINITY_DN4144_c0_g1~~TRINITY_DN4144_c0_g1_i4.p1  ORF type:complete len:461 (+),score=67.62 TRINITY_DN4144_c0_g1_i4:23-1384(+)